MSHCGQRAACPQARHCTCVANPRRFKRSMTWPPPASAHLMPAMRRGLTAPSDRLFGSRRSTVSTAGSCDPPTRLANAHIFHSPRRQRANVSSDGVAEPSTSGTLSAFAIHSATSRAWYRGAVPCLNDVSCSSSMTIKPSRGAGAKIALRAPTITPTRPAAISLHCACRSVAVRWLCSTATLPKRARKRSQVCGVRLISGTSTIACLPYESVSSTACR